MNARGDDSHPAPNPGDEEIDARLTRAGEGFRSQHQPSARAHAHLETLTRRPRPTRWSALAPAAAVAAVAAVVLAAFWAGPILGNRGGSPEVSGAAAQRGGSSWNPDLPAGVGPVEVAGAVPPINESISFPRVQLGRSFRPRADIAVGHPYCLVSQLDFSAELLGDRFAFVARLKPGERPCRLSGYPYFEFSKDGRSVEVLGGSDSDPRDGDWPSDPLVTAEQAAVITAQVSDWCTVQGKVDTAIFFDSENGTQKVDRFPAVRCPALTPGTPAEPVLPRTYWQPQGWSAEPVIGDFSGLRLRLVDTLKPDYPGSDWDGTPTWVVELTATDHDVVLDPCPGYQILQGAESLSSGADEWGTWLLNCQAVSTKGSDGTPYLAKGEPVRFAIWGSPPNGSTQTFRLLTPSGARDLPLDPGASAPTGAPRLVDEETANLHLYVSNQSFDRPRVRVRVRIDGVTLVDQDFAVEGQHNWVAFEVALAAGTHQVEITGPDGASEIEVLHVPARGVTSAVTNYWGNDGHGEFDWRVSDRSIAFD